MNHTYGSLTLDIPSQFSSDQFYASHYRIFNFIVSSRLHPTQIRSVGTPYCTPTELTAVVRLLAVRVYTLFRHGQVLIIFRL